MVGATETRRVLHYNLEISLGFAHISLGLGVGGGGAGGLKRLECVCF